MLQNAIILPNVSITDVNTGIPYTTTTPIVVKARILLDDIEITEFVYNGVWYTVLTQYVVWLE